MVEMNSYTNAGAAYMAPELAAPLAPAGTIE